jgi:hypothetical protein
MALESRPDGRPRLDIPQPHRLVVRCGGQLPAIWREDDRIDTELWPSRADPMAVPVSTSHNRTVLSIRCGGQLPAIWREDNRIDPEASFRTMALQCSQGSRP